MASLSVLLTADFWKGMGFALFRTFVAAIVPFLLSYSAGVQYNPWVVVSQVGLVLVITVLSSLGGIPQPGPDAGFWEVLGSRFLRQFTQFMIAGIGTILMFQDVPWTSLVLGALASAAATAMQASLIVIPGVTVDVTLPEIEPVSEEDPVYVYTDDEPTAEDEMASEANEEIAGVEGESEVVEETEEVVEKGILTTEMGATHFDGDVEETEEVV